MPLFMNREECTYHGFWKLNTCPARGITLFQPFPVCSVPEVFPCLMPKEELTLSCRPLCGVSNGV